MNATILGSAGQAGAESPDQQTVLLLCGSPAERSHTHELLRHVAVLLGRRGARPALWCLRERPLPPVDPAYHGDPRRHPVETVRAFVDVVAMVDAVVLGTPLYHGSYSSTLKNALDNLHYDALRAKPVGLVSNAGGLRSTNQAFEHLRTVVRTLFGYTTQCQIGTCSDDYAQGSDGLRLTSDDVCRRCEIFADELLLLAITLRRARADDRTARRS